MMTFNECITLLETLFDWPLVVFILVLFFFIKFQRAIEHFIKNLKIETPQGSISAQAQEALNAETAGNFVSFEDQQKLVEYIQGLETLVDQRGELESVVQQIFQDKQRFEFLWINQVLSANQKRGIHFIQKESPYIGYFKETMLKQGIPNIEWLITFLKNFELIDIHEGMISITQKGQQFINFMNWMLEINGPDALKSLFEQGYYAGIYDAKNK